MCNVLCTHYGDKVKRIGFHCDKPNAAFVCRSIGGLGRRGIMFRDAARTSMAYPANGLSHFVKGINPLYEHGGFGEIGNSFIADLLVTDQKIDIQYRFV